MGITDDLILMQRFTLIHDGSGLGWQAAYLAFYVAVRLGAPLRVLLVDPSADDETLAQKSADIEIGGRAAGVEIETQIVADISLDTITGYITDLNGLFIPKRLVPDGETAARWLEVVSCPLWIVSRESVTRKMAVLVENPDKDEDLITYTARLAQRMNETLTGLIPGEESPSPTIQDSIRLTWVPLQVLSLPSIVSALNRLHIDLLFIRPSNTFLVSKLDCTCVVYPGFVDA